MGPASQSPGRESPEALIVSSGPVTLDIRPLSAYQQQLIDRIEKLRSLSWTDRQIANHFNEIGYLHHDIKCTVDRALDEFFN